MGMFFSNIHIRKNSGCAQQSISDFMQEKMIEKGYRLQDNPEDAEIELGIYMPDDSNWISIASDGIQFNNDEDNQIGAELSEKFQTDVLTASCVDSDFMFMHLINIADNTDGWVNIGKTYSGKTPRRTKLTPWKNKVEDFEKFKKICREDYTFAEEAFYETSALLGMDISQCAYTADNSVSYERGTVMRLYFSLPEDRIKELPKLAIALFSLAPCKIGESTCVFVNNKGAGSKGVAVMFVGNYIKDDSLFFENVTFESDYGSDKRKIVPIKLEKVKSVEGDYLLYWEDKDFVIPTRVNPDLPYQKFSKLEFEKQFGVRFTVLGDSRKVLDVKVFIIPLENYQEGADCWYVYRYSGSKAKYIEEHGDFFVLNPEDYDL